MGELPHKSTEGSSSPEDIGALRYFGGYDDIDYFNGDNDDKYRFPEDPDPLNELIEEPEDFEYFDDDAPSFKLKDAGVFLEPQTVLRIMEIASGKFGYFQRVGQVEGRNSSYALEIAREQIGKISSILKPIFVERGMPEEKHAGEVDRIMSELRKLYSSTPANRKAWEVDRVILLEDANNKLKEKKRKQSLGETALGGDQPPIQRPIDGFDEI